MEREKYIRIISGEAEGVGPLLSRAALTLASGLYYLGATTKSVAYRSGLFKQQRVDARVVSIGNISVGGAGKTPATIFFARRFLSEGRNVAVLSRGYGRRTRMDVPLAVSNRTQIVLGPHEAGDEPCLIARKLPGVPVVVCGERVRGAEFAIERFDADTIILDDGFQHMALARDEDIVVIDCSEPFGFGHVLPRGLLREPLNALGRATAFLLTRAGRHEHAHIVRRLKEINPEARILKSRHKPVRVRNVRTGAENPCDFLACKNVFALSSIGNPHSFEDTLLELQAAVAGSRRFRDHHWYTPADINTIKEQAEQSGADLIVTTEKDAVRLELVPGLPDMFLLEIELELLENGGQIPARNSGSVASS